MSISYSGLRTTAKTSLPSVEGWGSNNNIIREPPRSIMTRKIDKVGSNMDLANDYESSFDRVNEAIQVYARGVNPMVGVNYNNAGSGGISGAQGHSPYPVNKDGAFRPPVQTPSQKVALSRQPREWTSAHTQKQLIDYSKKLEEKAPARATHAIQTMDVKPSKSYNIQPNFTTAPSEVKYVIQNPVIVTASSGVRTMDITNRKALPPTKGASGVILNGSLFTTKNAPNIVNSPNTVLDASRYVNAEIPQISVSATPSSSTAGKGDRELDHSIVEKSTRNGVTISYIVPKARPTESNVLNNNIFLARNHPEYSVDSTRASNVHVSPTEQKVREQTRNMPEYSATTTKTKIGDGSLNSTRNVELKPSLTNVGSTQNSGIRPTTERVRNNVASGILKTPVKQDESVSQIGSSNFRFKSVPPHNVRQVNAFEQREEIPK